MSVSISGSQITFNDSSTQTTAATGFGFKNRIINGAMQIDQRNAGASTTPTTNATYNLDRWRNSLTQASKYSVQQNAGSVTPPAGFANYLGVTSTSAYSVLSGDIFGQMQMVEGYNMADFSWGTASASSVTLSFKVYSSLTGTFGGSISNNANNRFYVFSYSIPVANTWTTISITIAGETTGTWLTTNGVGMAIHFGLGVGSTYSGTAGSWGTTAYYSVTGATSVVGTNGATFYITGVQLEKGSTATSFDYRPYTTELQLCQRYLPAFYNDGASAATGAEFMGYAYGTNSAIFTIPFLVEARVVPTGFTITALSTFIGTNAANSGSTPSAITFNSASRTSASPVATFTCTASTPIRLDMGSGARIYFNGCEL